MSDNPNKPSSATAAGTYAQHAHKHTPDQRELEGLVLLKAVKKLQHVKDNWGQIKPEELEDTLNYNRQIWMMFVDTAMEDKDPNRSNDLRSNIANLGMFIFNHTLVILGKPEKSQLDVLIDINRDIAAGLMTKVNKDGQAAGQAPPPTSSFSSSS